VTIVVISIDLVGYLAATNVALISNKMTLLLDKGTCSTAKWAPLVAETINQV
jgi:hypothetical protein